MANKTMHHTVIGPDTFELVDQSARADVSDLKNALNSTNDILDDVYNVNPLLFDTGYFDTSSATIKTGGGYNNFITSAVLFDVTEAITLSVDTGYQCWFYLYNGDTYTGNYASFTASRNFSPGVRVRFMLSKEDSSAREPITNPMDYVVHLHGITDTGLVPDLQVSVEELQNKVHDIFNNNLLEFELGYFDVSDSSNPRIVSNNNFITSTKLFEFEKPMTLTVDSGYQCWFYLYSGDTYTGRYDSFTSSRNFTAGSKARFMFSKASNRTAITDIGGFLTHLHGFPYGGVVGELQSQVDEICDCIAEENEIWG